MIFFPFGAKPDFEILGFSPGEKPCFPQGLNHGETVLYIWSRKNMKENA